MRRKVKISTSVEFDECREKDMLNGIDEFTSKRQLGRFIEGAIRLVYNHPDEAKILGFPFNTDAERNKFFSETNKKVEELIRKVDKIYEQMLIVLIAQKLGKGVALGDKAGNVLEASMELERQIKSLSDALGLPAGAKMFSRNSLSDSEGEAQVVVDFITDNYRGFVESLTGDLRAVPQVVYTQPAQLVQQVQTEQSVHDSNVSNEKTDNQKLVSKPTTKQTSNAMQKIAKQVSEPKETGEESNDSFMDALFDELEGSDGERSAVQEPEISKDAVVEFSLDDDIAEEKKEEKQPKKQDYSALAMFMGIKKSS